MKKFNATVILVLLLTQVFTTTGQSATVALAPMTDPFTDIGVTMPSGFGPVAWGDYNNDGRLDVLTGDGVYRNDGNGVFTKIPEALTGKAWGDYNNDGFLDILTGDEVCRNIGDYDLFTCFGADLGGQVDDSAAWGDYNNDGRLDILMVGSTYGSHVYRNDGNNIFTDIGAGLSTGFFSSAAWGDYNNDGRLDILLTLSDYNSNNVTEIYRNDGNDVFTEINAGLTGVSEGSVAWGDYNNDGRLDILLTGKDNNNNGVAKIYRNDGNDVFTDIGAGLTGVYSGSAAWGDYNNDGRLDIVLTGTDNNSNNVTKIYRNDANGVFADIGAALTSDPMIYAAWGDYDNDGSLDILLSGNGNAKIYHNNSTVANMAPTAPIKLQPSFGDKSVTLNWSPSSDSQTPAAGLNYNLRVATTSGGMDVVAPMAGEDGFRRVPQLGNTNQVTSRTINNLEYGQKYYWSVQAIDTAWAGSAWAAEGQFTMPPVPFSAIGQVLGTLSVEQAAWGDYNNDGRLDILVTGADAAYNQVTTIFRNDGSGVFTDIHAALPFSNFTSSPWGDYNNDGRLDILTTDRVYRNDGNGVFTDIGVTLTGALAWGDYNNDGKPDILAANDDDPVDVYYGYINIYRNDGNDTFTDMGPLAGITGYYMTPTARGGDFNNDGRLDLLVMGTGSGAVYRNDGNYNFTAVKSLPGGDIGAWADYNNDGKLDFALIGEYYDGAWHKIARIYRNDGGGTFTDINAGLPDLINGSVAWGDCNNDGRPDLVLTGSTTDTYPGPVTPVTKVFLNQGGDTFVESLFPLAGFMEGSAGWGDYDNDGKLDLLLTGRIDDYGHNAYTIYHNNAITANTVPSSPTGLASKTTDRDATLSWNPASDSQTPAAGLSYSLRVGTTPGGMDVVAPLSTSSGSTRVPAMGNVEQVTSAVLTNLPYSKYYWSVQAVDTAFGGSPFAGEQSFSISPISISSLSVLPKAAYASVPNLFTVHVDPANATLPITYTWEASGLAPVTHTGGGLTDTVSLTWPLGTVDPQTVKVTANNLGGSLAYSLTIPITPPSLDPHTLLVDTTSDSNDPTYQACTTAAIDCSLRGAISKANADTGNAYTIQLPSGTYILTLSGDDYNNASGDLNIKGSLTIAGSGTDVTTINGNQLDRVMYIASGAVVTIDGVTLTGGKATRWTSAESGQGGGIYNAGTLKLIDVMIAGNQAVGSDGNGGQAGLSLAGQDCSTLGGNNGWDGTAGGAGGSGRGGGIYNASILNANNLVLGQNQAIGGRGGSGGSGGGGAAARVATNGVLICAGGNGGNSGASGAGAPGLGGGLYNAGTAALSFSSVTGNTAAGGAGTIGPSGGSGGGVSLQSIASGYGGSGGAGGDGANASGGGIYNLGLFSLTSSAVKGNHLINGDGGKGGSGGDGGGVGANGGSGGSQGGGSGIYNLNMLSINASLIADNSAGNGGAGGKGGDCANRTSNGTVSIYKGGNGGYGGGGNSGGGLLIETETLSFAVTVTNSFISNNSAGAGGAPGGHGAGLNAYDGGSGSAGSGSAVYIAKSSLNLVHTTIVSNTGGDGSGISVANGAALGMTNTILAGHAIGINLTSGSATLDSTLLGSGTWANGLDWQGAVMHTHDYSGDPGFANPVGGDYHLAPGSSAIDKGISSDVATDIDNQPRPNPSTSIPDLGADEYWVLVPLDSVDINGPATAEINQPVNVTAAITPGTATPNITYTWVPEPVSGQNTSAATFAWSTTGDKTIRVTAQNAGGAVSATHTITLSSMPCYSLSLSHTGSGSDPTVTPSNSSGCPSAQFLAGEVINLTAHPDMDYQVSAWLGTDHDATTTATNTLTMPASAANVSVTYTRIQHTTYLPFLRK